MPSLFNPYANIFYMTNTYFPWKGRTFTQISSAIQLNKNNAVTLTPRQLRMPPPLKIYRRELAVYGASHNDISNNPLFLSNRRISNKIEYFNMPGSNVVSTKASNPIGICDTVDFNVPNNKTELPGTCKTNCVYQTCITDQACNARKRVRSAGMIKKIMSPMNNKTYYTNTSQYLIDRSLSFSTNEYAYLRRGNASAKPGPGTALTNVYSTRGVTHCAPIQINSTNNRIQYVWIDGKTYTIIFPDGLYDLDSLIYLFNAQVFNNNTYLFNVSDGVRKDLLTIGYNNYTNLIYLQSINANNLLYLYRYTDRAFTPVDNPITPDYFTTNPSMPYFIIPQTGIQQVIGFRAGNYNQYPNASAPINAQSPSNIPHLIQTNYARVNYKPNNSKFAQQGAVSSSARLLRKKYDIITNNASSLKNAFGNSAASAMSYGVTEHPYTVKEQVGYPQTKYPYVKNGKIVCASDKGRISCR